MANALVLGAGISGLTAAWVLRRAGWAPVVIDPDPVPGGVLQTAVVDRPDGRYVLEMGPNTVIARPGLVATLDGLALTPRVVEADAAAKRRYVLRRGRPVALPSGLLSLLRTPLWSPAAKLRLLTAPFQRLRGPADETVAAFGRRLLGREVCETTVEPFVGGTYAGDPDRLELETAFRRLRPLRRHHSLLSAALAPRSPSGPPPAVRGLISFPEGLAELPRALAAGLERPDAGAACGVRRTAAGWAVETTSGAVFEAPVLVVALPAPAASTLIGPWAPAAAAALERVPYASVAVVHVGTGPGAWQARPDGFGVLVPRAERRNILGALFPSNIFADRAPAGHLIATVFIGGDRQPALAHEDDDALTQRALHGLDQIYGLRATPTLTRVLRYPAAIPQYRPGHAAIEAAAAAAERAHAGLALIGSWRGGVGVPDCVASATEAAQRLLSAAGS